jgi:hypothetical protein
MEVELILIDVGQRKRTRGATGAICPLEPRWMQCTRTHAHTLQSHQLAPAGRRRDRGC